MNRFLTGFTLFSLIWGITFIGIAQQASEFNNIFFGDIQKSKNTVRSLQETKDGNILCVQSDNSFFRGLSKKNNDLTFDYINDLSLPKSKPANYYGDGKKSKFINYTFLGDQILGLSYKTTALHRGPEFFYHIINPKFQEKSNHGFPVSIFDARFNTLDYSRFAMISKDDASYAAAIYFPHSKANENSHISYAIFKDDFSAPSQYNLIYPYPSRVFEPIDFNIIDKEMQLFFTGHYATTARGNRIQLEQNFDFININHLDNNKLTTTTFQSPGLFFVDVKLYTEDDKMLLIGLYSSQATGIIEGTFSVNINQEGEIENQVFTQFPPNVKFDLQEYEKSLASSLRFSQVEYAKFNIIDAKMVDDGMVIVSEFKAVEYRYSGSDMPGSTSVVDTYYWRGDIMVSKTDTLGNLVWTTTFPKTQRTINDGGYFLSASTYFSESNLHLFFNDNADNYNQEGNYILNYERPDFTKLGNLKNTIGHVDVDMSTGVSSRKTIIGRSESNVIFVPQLSVPLPEKNKMIIYGVNGNRHRIGYLTFLK